MDDQKKAKTSNFKPANPSDPKMPSLKTSLDNTNAVWEEKTQDDNDVYMTNNRELNETKKTALAWLRSAQTDDNVINELDPETYPDLIEPTGKKILPNPYSLEKLDSNRINQMNRQRNIDSQNDIKIRIRSMHDIVRNNLTEEHVKLICDTFKEKVIKVTKKEVILKYSKYGFEFFYNNSDNRFWISTITFDEPFNPKKLQYLTLWIGNTFLGYGFKDLKMTIEKAKEMMIRGRTGNILWKDYLIEYSSEKNRIVSGNQPLQMTYEEYIKFQKWFMTNKIWIFVKRSGNIDAEDLMIQTREQKRSGQKVNPLAGLQSKMLDGPRKAHYIYGYPVKKPNYKGDDYVNSKNKLYEVGFTYS